MRYFLSALIAAIVAFAILHVGVKTSVTKENSYDRIVRTGELRCGYVNWYPYFIKDVNNKDAAPTGVNVEITNAVAKILGLKVTWAEEVGWGTLSEGLETGRYDAICTSAWPDSPKIKHLSLSDAMFYDTLYPYVRADDKRFDGNANAINAPDVKIAAVEGGTSMENAQNAFPNAKIFAISPNAPTGDYYATVSTHKADVLITSPDEFKAFDKSNPGKIKRVENVKPIKFMPMCMIFGLENDKLRDRVNFALQMLVDNGDMDKMVGKYSKEYVLRRPSHN
jgi:polar amino acid transport system substrate-binding protein